MFENSIVVFIGVFNKAFKFKKKNVWSRARHFSSSLSSDKYLNLGSKSDLRAEILGSIVWYNAQFLLFMIIYGNLVLWGYN